MPNKREYRIPFRLDASAPGASSVLTINLPPISGDAELELNVIEGSPVYVFFGTVNAVNARRRIAVDADFELGASTSYNGRLGLNQYAAITLAANDLSIGFIVIREG